MINRNWLTNVLIILAALFLLYGCNIDNKNEFYHNVEKKKKHSVPGKETAGKKDKRKGKGSSEELKAEFTRVVDDEGIWMEPYYMWSFGLRGGYLFPVSAFNDLTNSLMFGNIFCDYNPKLINNLVGEGEIGYINTSVKTETDNSIHFITAGANIKYEYPLSDLFLAYGLGGGGLSYGILSSERRDDLSSKNYFGWYGKAAIGMSMLFDYDYEISIGGQYQYFQGKDESIQGVGGYLQIGYRLDSNPQNILNKFVDSRIKVEPVFPAEVNYYAINGIGTVVVSHNFKRKIKSLKVKFYVKDFMDNPSYGDVVYDINPKAKFRVPIKASFNTNIFDITSKKNSTATITLEYNFEHIDRTFEKTEIVDVSINGRNAITWDNTKKIGAFITPTDPVVYNFARKAVELFRETNLQDKYYLPNKSLQKAISVWAALKSYGMQYVSDPNGFKKTFGKEDVIDYVQYPRELLKSKSGDCDDFTVLYCSLLESLGIRTAIMTIPGHIFMLFNTGVMIYDLDQDILDSSMVVVHASKRTVWIPMEVTMLGSKKSFMNAWKQGIKNVSDLDIKAQKEFIRVATCHDLYIPISLGSGDLPLNFKELHTAEKIYTDNVNEYRSWLFNNINDFLKKKKKKKFSRHNIKGMIYSNYKMFDKSRREFRKAIKLAKKKRSKKSKKQRITAMFNLGLLYYRQKEYDKALKEFNRMLKLDRENERAFYGLALVYDATNQNVKRDRMIEKLPEIYRRKFTIKTDGDTSLREHNFSEDQY